MAKVRFSKVLFGWTDHHNDVKHIKAMKALGLDAIIYDQINLKIDNFKKSGVFRQTTNRLLSVKNTNQEEVIETVMDAIVRVSPTKSRLGHMSDISQVDNLSSSLESLELEKDANEIADSLASKIRYH